MRVGLLMAGGLLACAAVSVTNAATVTMSPPPAKIQAPDSAKDSAKNQAKVQAQIQTKVDCPCDCPKVEHHAPVRHTARHATHRYAASGYYRYASAAPIFRREWHGPWRAAPNDAFIPGPGAYDGPPPGYDEETQVDDRNLTGGVGYAPDGGGGGGGFVDGFGQIHFANGGSVENGPTYNDYNQSFQFNPSQAGPFQPRLMGGFAPRR
jgi:hypothetical protein